MRLQLALDIADLGLARAALEKVVDLVDIVEIGTTLIIKEGIRAVAEIKKAHPTLPVLADLKIMDAGEIEAQIAFEAGADMVTVLGVAHDFTIEAVVKRAQAYNGEVMVDLLAVKDVGKRAEEVNRLGCDYVCVHTGVDAQAAGLNPLQGLETVSMVLDGGRIAVAGGIVPQTLPHVMRFRPGIVIVGGSITRDPDPRRVALAIKQQMTNTGYG